MPSKSTPKVAEVVPLGRRPESLRAIRDRLAAELDDVKWSKHKAECRCVCGIADPRSLVALAKELREVIRELDAMPEAAGKDPLDGIEQNVRSLDAHRRQGAPRKPAAGQARPAVRAKPGR